MLVSASAGLLPGLAGIVAVNAALLEQAAGYGFGALLALVESIGYSDKTRRRELLELAARSNDTRALTQLYLDARESDHCYARAIVEQLMLLLSSPENYSQGYRGTFLFVNKIYANNKTKPQPRSMIKEIYLFARQPRRGQGKQHQQALAAVETYLNSFEGLETNSKFCKVAINKYLSQLRKGQVSYAGSLLMVGGASPSAAHTAEELFASHLGKANMKEALGSLQAQSHFCHGPAREMVTKAIRNAIAINLKDAEA